MQENNTNKKPQARLFYVFAVFILNIPVQIHIFLLLSKKIEGDFLISAK